MRPITTAYAIAAAATSLGALLPDDRVHAAAKYAIAPLAAIGAATHPGAWAPARRGRTATLVASLAGSGVGDHFMLAESRSSGLDARHHLRRGASAFAAQQVGFVGLMLARGQRPRRRAGLACGATLAALGVVDAVAARTHAVADPIQPPAGATPDPVVAGYGVLLTAMAAIAQDDRRTALGGAVFLASDAAIVARQLLPHGAGRRGADALVMATYTAALGLLVDGLARP